MRRGQQAGADSPARGAGLAPAPSAFSPASQLRSGRSAAAPDDDIADAVRQNIDRFQQELRQAREYNSTLGNLLAQQLATAGGEPQVGNSNSSSLLAQQLTDWRGEALRGAALEQSQYYSSDATATVRAGPARTQP